MRLEGIMTCVNYADFLAETLPLNLKHFDDLVVVTTPEDIETQRLCRYYGVRHAQTDQFRSRWGEFHKSLGINVGLEALDLNDWVLHFDSDIALPPNTRSILEMKNLERKFLYGVDRYCVQSYDEWRKHQALPWMQQDGYHIQLNNFDLAPRFAGMRLGGYSPPGFFQLWNPRGSGVEVYPEQHNTAARTDVLFTANWWPNQRHLIPELVVYHLESEHAPQGANWSGRRTRRFGPEPDEKHPLHPRNHKGPPAWNGTWTDSNGHHHPHPEPYPHPKPKPHVLIHPTVRGFARVGNTLVGKAGKWSGEHPIKFTYEWQRKTKEGNWTPICNSNGLKHTVTQVDLHHQLRLQVKAQNKAGWEIAYSHPTHTVRAK